MDCLMAGLLPTQRAEAMRRSTAAKLLVVVLTLLAGLASSFQWLRHPSRLHADLANRDYILVKFSPDGKTLITVERSPNDSLFDCRIRLWDMASGQEKQALATDWLIDEALLSRNGMFLAALWSGNQLRVWNTSTWQSWTVAWQDEPFDLDGPAMRFSPDSKMLAVEVRSHGCSVFDTATGQELAQFNGRLCNLAFAPDSQSVVSADGSSATDRGILRLWDAKTRRQLLERETHRDRITCVSFSPDGTTIASATMCQEGSKAEIKLSDRTTLQERAAFLSDSLITSLFFSPDGRLLVESDGTQATVWDVRARPPQKLSHFAAIPRFTPDGTRMVVIDETNRVADLWDTASGQRLTTFVWSDPFLPDSHFFPQFVRSSPDGKQVALLGTTSGGRNRLVQWLGQRIGLWNESAMSTELWDINTGRRIAVFEGEGAFASDCKHELFAPDSQTLVTQSEQGRLRLWDLPPSRPIKYLLGFCLSATLLLLVLGSWCCGRLRAVPPRC
ncbi:MAG TPA: hypothetical protein VGY66_03145 [Gemmataceae bacterium]|nr:hypothetical protein [Gemmataceae bacterium]